MRTMSPAFALHLSGDATTLCHCWRLVRRDGTIFGFTDHDGDVVLNGLTYAARTGADPSHVESALGFAAGGFDLAGALACDGLTGDDLANGLYDGATLETWLVNWADTAQFTLQDIGTFGEVKRSDHAFVAELRSIAHAFDEERGRLYTARCSADLGDARCGVALAGYTLDAHVVAVDGLRLAIDDGSRGQDYFAGGTATFTTGGNAGAIIEIRADHHDATGAWIDLWSTPAQPVAVGDAIRLTAGCDKTHATCIAKFGNAINFRGFPYMPGNDRVLAYPSQGDAALDGGSLFR